MERVNRRRGTIDFDKMMSNAYMPSIKREMLRKKQRQYNLVILRDSLPKLSPKEIRRYSKNISQSSSFIVKNSHRRRLPYHEALITDLLESDYDRPAALIRDLVDNQEQFDKGYAKGQRKEKLAESNEVLDELFATLTTVEDAIRTNDVNTQFIQLIHVSRMYAFGVNTWWWLGERLLRHMLETIQLSDKQESLVRLLLGKFLMENAQNAKSALEHLNIGRNLSMHHDWPVPKTINIIHTDYPTINSYTCFLLHKSLMAQIRALAEKDTAAGIEMCYLARKRAAEACYPRGQFDALMALGSLQLTLKEKVEAVVTFERALRIAINEDDIHGICEARFQYANALFQKGLTDEALENFNILWEFTEKHQILTYRAMTFGFLGELYQNQGKPDSAITFFFVAFHLFDNLDGRKRNEIRDLLAMASADQLFAQYQDLILDSNEDVEKFTKLLNWKDNREPFWTGESVFDYTYEYACQKLAKGHTHK